MADWDFKTADLLGPSAYPAEQPQASEDDDLDAQPFPMLDAWGQPVLPPDAQQLYYREHGPDIQMARVPFKGAKTIKVAGTTAYVDKLHPGLQDWADDMGYRLVEYSNIRLAEYPGGGNMLDHMRVREDNELYNNADPKFAPERALRDTEPSGPFECKLCGAKPESFGQYKLHMDTHQPQQDEIQDGHFPGMQLGDEPLGFGTNPSGTAGEALASVHTAALGDNSDFGPDNETGRPLEAWEPGTWGKGMVINGQPYAWPTDRTQQPHHDDLLEAYESRSGGYANAGSQIVIHPSGYATHAYSQASPQERQDAAVFHGQGRIKYVPDENQWDKLTRRWDLRNDQGYYSHFQPWQFTAAPKGKEPKDLIEAPVPFVYDIPSDKLHIGYAGTTTHDVPGKISPGGIVEGYYEPGGKITIETYATHPWSVRHLLDLWYHQAPQMEITGLEQTEADGKATKLAGGPTLEGPDAEENGYTPLPGGGDYYGGGGCYYLALAMHHTHGLPIATSYGDDGYLNHAWVHDGKRGYDAYGVHSPAEAPGWNWSNKVNMDTDPRELARSVSEDGMKGAGSLSEYDPENPWMDSNLLAADEFADQHFAPTQRTAAAEQGMHVGPYIQTLLQGDQAANTAYKALRAAGGKVYAVGGAPRDALQGKIPNDIDLMVAGIPAPEVEHILKQLPGNATFAGKNFGVFHYHNGGDTVEIAMPRSDEYEGGSRGKGNITVDPDLPIADDLRRRDFTANATAVDLDTGELIDPHGGADDIKRGVLRTTHPDSFWEDPSRLVRALTMHGRFGLQPDEQTRHEMEANGHLLRGESPDTLNKVFTKTLKSDNPAAAIRLARDTGLLQHLLPEVHDNWNFEQNNHHHAYPLGEHLLHVLDNVSRLTPDPDVRFAALMHDVGKPASAWTDPDTGESHYYRGPNGEGAFHEQVGAQMAEDRLRKTFNLQRTRINRIHHLINHHMFAPFTTPKGARRFMHKVGDENVDDLLNLRQADQTGKGQTPDEVDAHTGADQMRNLIEQQRVKGETTGINAISVNGNDLLGMGMKPGPEVGKVLTQLQNHVVDDPSMNDRETLLNLAQQYAQASPGFSPNPQSDPANPG